MIRGEMIPHYYSWLILLPIISFHSTQALSLPTQHEFCRRKALSSVSTTATAALLTFPSAASAASTDSATGKSSSKTDGGLAAKLSKRDPSALRNSVFNIPPPSQIYPEFMKGEWKVQSRFNGFLFPSQKIPKEKLTADIVVPGFQKCSIASVCDVGKEVAEYRMRIAEGGNSGNGKGLMEDRRFNLAGMIDAYLGYPAVEEVIYDGSSNPNRISAVFSKSRTRNAERIELFCNARESELIPAGAPDGTAIFVCSEYIRQVTFSLSQEFGVARQVVGNYAHFWTWREQSNGSMIGNLLTAAYLDPQDPLFFDEPSKPVAVYSHNLIAERV